MKNLIFRLLQLIALALFSWVLMLYLSWPAWGGLAIFFGVIGAYFGIKLAKRLWLVSRSRVKLAASEAAGRLVQDKSNSAQSDLTRKWKEAIATLRHSSLRRFGNPVYALPWYMVIGESGVGKTSALTRSRLGSLNKGGHHFEPITQTVNCDWWFFNRAVVIDTAGRYVSAAGTPEDHAEWERMLELLAKYRLKEGLNGLVLAINAEQLLQGDDALEHHGHVIRERIDQLIRLFDKRFPIFLLITKCDRIYGFEQWARTLPAEALGQAMGYVGPLEDGDGAEARFSDQALDQITARLKQLRLDMGVKGVELSAPLLLLPEEIERLRGGLKRFLAACMGNNPYLEQPLLRGLFLSSARQDGGVLPSLLGSLIQSTDTPQVTEKGTFLQDFFERVLPADRGTFRPTIIVDRWRLATRNLAAVFWICTCAAALLFLMLSYHQTRSSLIAIRDAYPMGVLIGDQPSEQRLVTLQELLRLIELIGNHERNWQTRWLAFSPDIEQLEDDIKATYVRGFRELLQKNRREDILPTLQDEAAKGSTNYANALLTLTRSINMTQARIDGATYDQLLKMPQAPEQLSEVLGLELPAHMIQAPAHMSAAYKAWSDPDDPVLLQGLEADRRALSSAITQTARFSWLVAWANQQRDLKPVTLRTFWLPGSQGPNAGSIPPALTLAGQRKIHEFLSEIEQALSNSTNYQFKRGAFEAWYQTERFNAWQSFAWSFDEGELLLANEPAWRDLVTKVDTDTSPYYAFIDRLREEFAGIPDEDLPGLMLFAREFPAMRRAASQGVSVDKAKALVETINTVGERVVRPITGNRSASASSTIRRSIQGVQAYADYAHQFDVAASLALQGTGQSYQMMADYFNLGTNPETTTSALQTTQDSLNAFRKASGFDLPDDQVIWKLIGGPLRILTRYALEQTSCYVQKEWEEKVLWKTQMAVSARETNDQLFGDKGSVWAFVDGPAKPFVLQKASQFVPARHQSYELPFSSTFMPFLNRSVDTRVEAVVRSQLAESSKGKSATILITARPIGVNEGAKAKPYSVTLSIQCAQQEITLDNFNMSVTNSFDWSPDQCGDVTLRIFIDDLTLTQRYPGPMGMARFIAEFQDGERIFTPDDFPQARERLEALDVRTLHVRYDFSGQEQLLTMASNLDYLADTSTPVVGATPARLAIKVPERIGQCWTEGPPEKATTPLPLYIQQRAQKLIAPPPPPPPSPPVVKQMPERTHRVKEGDTLYSLARQYETDVQTLQQLNHLKNTDLIMKGQILKLPPAGATTSSVETGPTRAS